MRITNRRPALVLSTVVTGALTILLLEGCSEPASTKRADGARVTETEVPSVSTSTALGGGALTTGTATPPVELPPADPTQVRAAWNEGVVLFDAKDYAAAAERLDVAVTGRMDDPYTHYLLGLARFKSGRLESAETALVESARLAPGSLKTWVNLARVRLDRDDAGAALEAADRALEIDGAHADALHQKGRAQAALGRRDEALPTLRFARETDPGNGQIANTLGYWLLQSGQPGEALEPLEAARTLLPGTAYVRNNLGVAYERTGRIDEALAEYRAAVECGDSGGRAAASLARLGIPTIAPVASVAGSADSD